ncbi:hypothetical protein GOZ79_21425 [Agrobacterium vitis]|nr:hypothetical protein [Agrobacterium vitis]
MAHENTELLPSTEFAAVLDNAWPVAMPLSAAIAFISSSSLAAVILVLSLTSTGMVSGGNSV